MLLYELSTKEKHGIVPFYLPDILIYQTSMKMRENEKKMTT